MNLNIHPAWVIVGAVSAVLVGAVAETDNNLESAVKNTYTFKHQLKEDDVSVKVDNGVVTLKGTVSQDYYKSLAEETALNVRGVTGVNNQLTVKGDQPEERSDGWITMKVKGSLAFHRNVSAVMTEVTTENGVVTLRGKADSAAEKQLAEEYASEIEGVKSVRNEITIASQPSTAKVQARTVGDKVDDASITAQVKTSLLFHRSTRAMATKVTTQDGVVTVKGEAKNAAEKQLVTKLVQDVNGVKRVDNQMQVAKS